MEKRFDFKCWNCKKNYSLYIDISPEQTVIVACPYCGAEGVVDLQPFLKQKKSIFKSEAIPGGEPEFELVLPDVLPTQKPPEPPTA